MEEKDITEQKEEPGKLEQAELLLPAGDTDADGSTASKISRIWNGLHKTGGRFINKAAETRENPDGRGSSYIGRLWFPLFYFIGLIVYLEVVFHFLVFGSFDVKIIYPVLFALPFAVILTIITGVFSCRGRVAAIWLVSALICIIFQVQLIYHYVFKVFFTFQLLGMAGDAVTEFGRDILTAMKENIVGLALLLLPLILLGFLMKGKRKESRRGLKEQGMLLGGVAVFHIAALLALLSLGRADYSPYDLYFNSHIPSMSGEQLGVITLTRFDVSSLLWKQEEELILVDAVKDAESKTDLDIDPVTDSQSVSGSVSIEIGQGQKAEPNSGSEAEPVVPAKPNATPTPTPLPTPTPIDTSPNVMDIDFQALADKEKDKTIKTLHSYFASAEPTNKNEYTGRFKGYNLILITAEGFSPYAVHEETAPTLYRLVREGFVFNNFYTALWQTSTSDGEYLPLTGLIPLGSRSMYRGRKNLWPFSLAHQFNKLGVESKAYHNHTYTYYQRDDTHPNLGYLWKAIGNGLKLPSNGWPRSDVEMIDATVEEYVDEEQFHVYYLTVSGHMNYTFAGNSMAAKNKALVENLPYSNDAKAYLACQLELDRALELLIAKLEEAGVADKTVIALSADHYPYGWEKEKLDELAGHVVDPDFEVYRNHFILWSEGMEETVVVDEPCSSLDILPTLSNLFGLEYDSRLLMGRDIFSDAEPLVMLSNRSFITDKARYNSETGEVTVLTEDPLPEDYTENLIREVKNKFSVSKSILKEDYYRILFQEIKE